MVLDPDYYAEINSRLTLLNRFLEAQQKSLNWVLTLLRERDNLSNITEADRNEERANDYDQYARFSNKRFAL